MVQWLGFHPSKVEVGVRFTVVAFNISFFFWDFFVSTLVVLKQMVSRYSLSREI